MLSSVFGVVESKALVCSAKAWHEYVLHTPQSQTQQQSRAPLRRSRIRASRERWDEETEKLSSVCGSWGENPGPPNVTKGSTFHPRISQRMSGCPAKTLWVVATAREGFGHTSPLLVELLLLSGPQMPRHGVLPQAAEPLPAFEGLGSSFLSEFGLHLGVRFPVSR